MPDSSARLASTPSKASLSKTWRDWLKPLVYLLALGSVGLGCYLIVNFYSKQSRIISNLNETQQVFDGSKNLPPEERATLLKSLFEKQGTLSSAEQKSLRVEMMKKFGDRMNQVAVDYSRLQSEEEKQAFLDRQIEEGEAMRRTFEALRSLGGIGGLFGGNNSRGSGAGNATGNGAGTSNNGSNNSNGSGNWNNATPEQMENWMKMMLSNTTPMQRASWDQFRTAMEMRRNQLGLGNNGWGPGR